MKKRTRWKRAYPSIIGRRFFDYGEYGYGYFTVIKGYRCKVYCDCAETPSGSHWFDKSMIVVKTDDGCKFKIPFVPWLKHIVEAKTQKPWHKFYDEQSW